jgi:REP element-mobilizing transposase RayT
MELQYYGKITCNFYEKVLAKNKFWVQHLWARGYFAANSGNVTDEIIIEYIKNQDIEENQKQDNFTIEGF